MNTEKILEKIGTAVEKVIEEIKVHPIKSLIYLIATIYLFKIIKGMLKD